MPTYTVRLLPNFECYKYLKSLRPLNSEYREVLLQALGISLNLFLNKVLSTQFELRLLCFSKTVLTFLAATLLTFVGVLWLTSWLSEPGFTPLPLLVGAPSGEDQIPISAVVMC